MTRTWEFAANGAKSARNRRLIPRSKERKTKLGWAFQTFVQGTVKLSHLASGKRRFESQQGIRTAPTFWRQVWWQIAVRGGVERGHNSPIQLAGA